MMFAGVVLVCVGVILVITAGLMFRGRHLIDPDERRPFARDLAFVAALGAVLCAAGGCCIHAASH
jgi:drug/metabolite transporter (DMT)-like permease